MRSRPLTAALFATGALAQVTCTPNPGPNLLLNPSFEQGMQDWAYIGPVPTAVTAEDGSDGQTYLVSPMTSQLTWVTQTISNLQPGVAYTVSIDWRSMVQQNSNANSRSCSVVFHHDTWASENFMLYYTARPPNGNTPWETVTATYTPTSSSILFGARIQCTAIGSTYSRFDVEIDNVKFFEAGTPICTTATPSPTVIPTTSIPEPVDPTSSAVVTSAPVIPSSPVSITPSSTPLSTPPVTSSSSLSFSTIPVSVPTSPASSVIPSSSAVVTSSPVISPSSTAPSATSTPGPDDGWGDWDDECDDEPTSTPPAPTSTVTPTVSVPSSPSSEPVPPTSVIIPTVSIPAGPSSEPIAPTSTITPTISVPSGPSSEPIPPTSVITPTVSVPSNPSSESTPPVSTEDGVTSTPSSAPAPTTDAAPTVTAGPTETDIPTQGSPSTTEFTTSTVFTTQIVTVTACPSTVPNCPASAQTTYTTTKTIALSTTICPVTATPTGEATTKPQGPAVTATATIPGSGSKPQSTTSTVWSTRTVTITACPSTVTNCPASSRTTSVTTETILVSTTICPVTGQPQATITAGQHPSGSNPAVTTETLLTTRTSAATACPSASAYCQESEKTTSTVTETLVAGTTVYTLTAATPAVTGVDAVNSELGSAPSTITVSHPAVTAVVGTDSEASSAPEGHGAWANPSSSIVRSSSGIFSTTLHTSVPTKSAASESSIQYGSPSTDGVAPLFTGSGMSWGVSRGKVLSSLALSALALILV